jgi:hypothetical protein
MSENKQGTKNTTAKILMIVTAVMVIIILLRVPVRSNNFHSSNNIANARYVGNKQTKVLHDRKHLSCQNYIKHIAISNRVYFRTKKQAYRTGYRLCKHCYR